MEYPVIEEGQFRYIETGSGEKPLMLLHGLLGALSNFQGIIDFFGPKMNVVVPLLPIFELPLRKDALSWLVQYVNAFVMHKGYDKVHVLGNSLGGHIALLFALENPEQIASIILTGSSGLFENAMGTSFPQRKNYEYIKKKAEDTFFDPKTATKELVDEIFEIVSDRNRALRVIMTAKSAIRHNLGENLHQVKAPTLLIWGQQDKVTPPFVGEKFNELIDTSKLYFLDKCGHAPMMEQPEKFNEILEQFLTEIE
ncbi:MAG: alpha/beta hydrolase [Saprospiraceae bacterium]|nr:alpha/beta hydrolase [Saprospiraceae bacterium]